MNIEKAPGSMVFMSYEEAVLYCRFLEYNDHKDWRLPTEEEYAHHNLYGWYLNDPASGMWSVLAVRDI